MQRSARTEAKDVRADAEGIELLRQSGDVSVAVFSRTANAVESPRGAQKQLSYFMEKYFVSMNMASRAQWTGEQLQRIDGEFKGIKALLEKTSRPAGASPNQVAARELSVPCYLQRQFLAPQ